MKISSPTSMQNIRFPIQIDYSKIRFVFFFRSVCFVESQTSSNNFSQIVIICDPFFKQTTLIPLFNNHFYRNIYFFNLDFNLSNIHDTEKREIHKYSKVRTKINKICPKKQKHIKIEEHSNWLEPSALMV